MICLAAADSLAFAKQGASRDGRDGSQLDILMAVVDGK